MGFENRSRPKSTALCLCVFQLPDSLSRCVVECGLASCLFRFSESPLQQRNRNAKAQGREDAKGSVARLRVLASLRLCVFQLPDSLSRCVVECGLACCLFRFSESPLQQKNRNAKAQGREDAKGSVARLRVLASLRPCVFQLPDSLSQCVVECGLASCLFRFLRIPFAAEK